MPCKTCGAAVGRPEKSDGGIKDGQFKEVYTCVNGHRGTVKGEASDPPRKWSRTGPVFNESVFSHERTRAQKRAHGHQINCNQQGSTEVVPADDE